jgi:hypothetical protein
MMNYAIEIWRTKCVETIHNTARTKNWWPSHVLRLATSIFVHPKEGIVPVSHMQQKRKAGCLLFLCIRSDEATTLLKKCTPTVWISARRGFRLCLAGTPFVNSDVLSFQTISMYPTRPCQSILWGDRMVSTKTKTRARKRKSTLTSALSGLPRGFVKGGW